MDVPPQIFVAPTILPGMLIGLAIVKEMEFWSPFPQGETGVTEIVPLILPALKVMELVEDPEVIILPEGTVQLYDEAPETGVIENTFPTEPEQMVLVPEIRPAFPAPVVILIAKFWLELVLQELIAETERVPPKLFEVMVITLVKEFPVQLEGKVQLYEVAPETVGVE